MTLHAFMRHRECRLRKGKPDACMCSFNSMHTSHVCLAALPCDAVVQKQRVFKHYNINYIAHSMAWRLTRCFVLCAGIRYIQENDYPVRGTYGLT